MKCPVCPKASSRVTYVKYTLHFFFKFLNSFLEPNYCFLWNTNTNIVQKTRSYCLFQNSFDERIIIDYRSTQMCLTTWCSAKASAYMNRKALSSNPVRSSTNVFKNVFLCFWWNEEFHLLDNKNARFLLYLALVVTDFNIQPRKHFRSSIWYEQNNSVLNSIY